MAERQAERLARSGSPSLAGIRAAEYAPSQDGEHRDKIYKSIGCSQFRFFGCAPGGVRAKNWYQCSWPVSKGSVTMKPRSNHRVQLCSGRFHVWRGHKVYFGSYAQRYSEFKKKLYILVYLLHLFFAQLLFFLGKKVTFLRTWGQIVFTFCLFGEGHLSELSLDLYFKNF